MPAQVGPPKASLWSLQRSPLYSEQLGIQLTKCTNQEYFKWFLASVLFGGRISETIARHTYQIFQGYGLLTPRKILACEWDFLVNPIMREGGYVRYDGRKSEQILRNCETLLNDYGGRLTTLHLRASDSIDLERRLAAFFGIGPVTVNIFLRELRPFWRKADPEPLARVKQTASALGIDLTDWNRKSMKFVRTEAGLIRLSQSRRKLRKN